MTDDTETLGDDFPMDDEELAAHEFVIYSNDPVDMNEAARDYRNHIHENARDLLNEEHADSLPVGELHKFIDDLFDDVWEMVDASNTSLWMRRPQDDFETPVYTKAPRGVWQSVFDGYHQSEGTPVSDAFYTAAYEMTKDDDYGWGGISQELFDELTEAEQEIWLSLRSLFIEMKIPHEIALLIEKGKRLNN